MATVYITEYINIDGTRQTGTEPPLAEQTVSITSGSVQSNPFNAQTSVIRVHTDAICSVLIGKNPTVTAASGRMAANQTEYRGVFPGQILAAITNS